MRNLMRAEIFITLLIGILGIDCGAQTPTPIPVDSVKPLYQLYAEGQSPDPLDKPGDFRYPSGFQGVRKLSDCLVFGFHQITCDTIWSGNPHNDYFTNSEIVTYPNFAVHEVNLDCVTCGWFRWGPDWPMAFV
ncbi:MAG: hypothetical protein K8R46_13265 [Pirellulales bacterium]|nr:hypothetical protein [Pirellulales bacterium]